MTFAINVLISATAISFASWLSGRMPTLAGFIIALPLATMLVLPMSYFQHGNPGNTVELARSILVAIPMTLTFFIPFLLSERLSLSFWQTYAAACAMLPLAFLAHRAVARLL